MSKVLEKETREIVRKDIEVTAEAMPKLRSELGGYITLRSCIEEMSKLAGQMEGFVREMWKKLFDQGEQSCECIEDRIYDIAISTANFAIMTAAVAYRYREDLCGESESKDG